MYGYTHNLVERELRDKKGTYFVAESIKLCWAELEIKGSMSG